MTNAANTNASPNGRACDAAAIREAFRHRAITMGRHSRLRVPLPVTIDGEGETAKATIRLPEGPVTMDATDWRRVVADLGPALPSIFPRSNSRGRTYLGIVLPPGIGEAKGEVAMLARVILGAAADGKHVRYRDGNPFNLCRSNLVLMDRKAAAAEHREG